jgi:hypothetical protein
MINRDQIKFGFCFVFNKNNFMNGYIFVWKKRKTGEQTPSPAASRCVDLLEATLSGMRYHQLSISFAALVSIICQHF